MMSQGSRKSWRLSLPNSGVHRATAEQHLAKFGNVETNTAMLFNRYFPKSSVYLAWASSNNDEDEIDRMIGSHHPQR